MPHLPGPSLLSREAPARVRRPAHITRLRSVSGASAARILNGSLHTSGRGCASREGHTNTLPALPLRAAQRDKRGRRTHAAAPQQHGAPIPSRTARTNWRSSPKVIPKRRLLVRQNSTSAVPGSGTTRILSTSNFQGGKLGNPELLQRYKFGTCRSRDINCATCRCNAARRKDLRFLF